MFAFATSPFIINVWTGPEIAQSFFNKYLPAETTLGWRWGHGVWAIILPVVTAPVLAVLFLNQRKAKRVGVLPEPAWRGKTTSAFLKELFFELDIIGLILVTAGFALVLLAITLAGYQNAKWREASIIVMLVVGFCSLVVAAVWESKFAKYPLIRWSLIRDRTVACACAIGFLFWVTFYCWDGCVFLFKQADVDYTSFLQVVHFRSVRAAGYLLNAYSFGSCITGIVLGFIIKYTGRYKIWAIIGVPIYILGTGMSILSSANHRVNDSLSRPRIYRRLSHYVSNLRCRWRRNHCAHDAIVRDGGRISSRYCSCPRRPRNNHIHRRSRRSRYLRRYLDQYTAGTTRAQPSSQYQQSIFDNLWKSHATTVISAWFA